MFFFYFLEKKALYMLDCVSLNPRQQEPHLHFSTFWKLENTNLSMYWQINFLFSNDKNRAVVIISKEKVKKKENILIFLKYIKITYIIFLKKLL